MRIRKTFQGKLFSAYSLVMIIIALSVSIPMYIYLKNGIEKNIVGSLNDRVTNTIDRMDETASEFDNISKQLYLASDTHGKSVIQYIEELSYNVESYDIYQAKKAVQNFVVLIPEIHARIYRISIITKQGELYSNLRAASTRNSLEYTYPANSSLGVNGETLIRYESQDNWLLNDHEPIFTFSRQLNPKENLAGYIEMQIKAADLLPFDKLKALPGAILTILYDNQVLYTNTQGDSISSDAGQVLNVSTEKGGFQLRLVVPKKVALTPVYVFRKYMLITVVVLILFSVLVFFLLSRLLTHPLLKLRKTIDSIDLDDNKLDTHNKYHIDEVELINRSIRTMDIRLKNSIEEIVHFRTLQIKSHFDTLQAQINPHFLFNMLGVIQASAENKQVDQIEYITRNLADFLRYSITADSPIITLDKEADFMIRYLELMQTRYMHRLEFSVDIAPELRHMLIPKLTLQPLVENCLQHGFHHLVQDSLKIEIQGQVKNERWELHIKDNGSGFTPESLQALNDKIIAYLDNVYTSKQEPLNIGGMGLISTIARLKFMFKESFQYTIGNNHSHGAFIILVGNMKI